MKKKVIISLVILLFVSVIQGYIYFSNEKSKATIERNKEVTCEKHVAYGDTKICLPEITGMTECYSNPIVKAATDSMFRGGDRYVLAYYLPKAVYELIDVIKFFDKYDYYIVYGLESTKNKKVPDKYLDDALQQINEAFSKIDWNYNDIYKDKLIDKLIDIGKPVLLESYSLNKNIKTAVVLMDVQIDNKEQIMIDVMNFLIIKERLIITDDIFIYEGKESITKAKAKNDYFVLRFLDENASR